MTVRLSIVRGLPYTDAAQVRKRWLISTYATAFRWTGNRTDAEDLTAWIFLNVGEEELVPACEDRLADLLSEAIGRHWSDRYGVDSLSVGRAAHSDTRSTLESLLAGLTAEMHLTLMLRFVRRRPVAAIAHQLGISVHEADRQVFVGLMQVAVRLAFPGMATRIPRGVDHVSAFVTDLVAGRRPVRFEACSATWPALVAACRVQASIAGNDLPTRRFVRSMESPPSPSVTELRIWSA